jgi:hypothetical protein
MSVTAWRTLSTSRSKPVSGEGFSDLLWGRQTSRRVLPPPKGGAVGIDESAEMLAAASADVAAADLR